MNTDANIGVALEKKILGEYNHPQFEQLALEVFRFQYLHNSVYREFASSLSRTPESVLKIDQIPFLPIQFFKSKDVRAFEGDAQITFRSSGTTDAQASCHLVKSLDLYATGSSLAFKKIYGNPAKYCFLALLPGYLERADSSLVWMVNHFISQNPSGAGGFYLADHAALAEHLQQNEQNGTKSILIGVSHALLSLAENHAMPLHHTILIETGGMKGRRKEITREELHGTLGEAFAVNEVHSEYGMTELLSQAYSTGGGFFRCAPWMSVSIRQATDPLSVAEAGSAGGINIIDLANLYSCSFIATDDLGRIHENGSFEVLGRIDNSDVRGCNLLLY